MRLGVLWISFWPAISSSSLGSDILIFPLENHPFSVLSLGRVDATGLETKNVLFPATVMVQALEHDPLD